MPVLQRRSPPPPNRASRTTHADVTTADLAEALQEARRVIADVRQFADDVDSDRVSVDDLGLELGALDEDDTLVEHARIHLRAVAAR